MVTNESSLLEGDDWKKVPVDADGIPQYPEKPEPPEPTDLPAGQIPPPFVPPPPNIWSEPFVDLNLNKKRDDTEAYLEKFGDTYFTEKALERPPDPRTPDNDDRSTLLVSWTDIRKIIGGDGE